MRAERAPRCGERSGERARARRMARPLRRRDVPRVPAAGRRRRVLDLGTRAGVRRARAALVLALRGLGVRRALRSASSRAGARTRALLHWAYVVTVIYGHAPVVVGVLAVLGMAALHRAVHRRASRGLAARLAPRGLAEPFVVAAAGPRSSGCAQGRLHRLHRGGDRATRWHATSAARLRWRTLAGVYAPVVRRALGGAALAAASTRCPRLPAAASRSMRVALGRACTADRSRAPLEPRDPRPDRRSSVAVLQGTSTRAQVGDQACGRAHARHLRAGLTRHGGSGGAQRDGVAGDGGARPPDADPGCSEPLAALAREVRTPLIVGAVGVQTSTPTARPARATTTARSCSPPRASCSTATTRPTSCRSASTSRCARCSARFIQAPRDGLDRER